MKAAAFVREVERMPGAHRRPALDTATAARGFAELGHSFGPEHHALIRLADGLSILDGHYALLGLAPPFGLVEWNHPEHWKFAWNGAADEYLCFGASAMGDQFAYRFDELRAGNSRVWLLDGFELSAQVFAPDFESFLDEFIRLPVTGDSLVLGGRERHGALAWNSLRVVVPPAQFGTKDILRRLQCMSARLAMVINGDACSESRRCEGLVIRRFSNYVDGHGRGRLRFETDG